MSYFGNNWCDLEWTPWINFSSSKTDWAILPSNQGVYRIRPADTNLLAYIGQTRRNLKERLSDLRRNTLAKNMPFNDPHTAAPNLWVWKKENNWDYECSAASTEFLMQEQLAFECFLLWKYRLENGESTLCNHGRFHKDYQKSRGRLTGFRGRKLKVTEKRNPSGGKSHSPLILVAEPLEENWMGLKWSKLVPFSTNEIRLIPKNPGLYKIAEITNQRLSYIGQTKNLHKRLRSHKRAFREKEETVFSYAKMSLSLHDYQLKELENDLIGAYYAQTKSFPTYQFVKL